MGIVEKKNMLVGVVSVAITLGVAGALVAYGFVSEPPTADKNQSVETPFNIGIKNQEKLGGIGINGNESTLGLYVRKDMRIGDDGAPQGSVLDIGVGGQPRSGDWFLSGSIFAQTDNKGKVISGNVGDTLTRKLNEERMDWYGGQAWLTIQQINIVGANGSCSQVLPACPNGWSAYKEAGTDNNNGRFDYAVNAECPTTAEGIYLGSRARICYKDF